MCYYENVKKTAKKKDGGKDDSSKLARKEQPPYLKDLNLDKAPMILFVVGGVTYSEIRSAYEMTALQKRCIYIGSDLIIDPVHYLNLLRNF